MTALQPQIEERLRASEPDVEVLLAEVVSGPAHSTLRVFVDHPEGVTLELCERVSEALGDLRERYAIEVSSPGAQRPLTKPSHFRRFVGRRARVRTRGPIPTAGACKAGEDPKSSFTGELVGATEDEVTLAAESGIVAIPYAEIRRSNLIED
jgi:ribosome maturation factor RimP